MQEIKAMFEQSLKRMSKTSVDPELGGKAIPDGRNQMRKAMETDVLTVE